MAGSGGFDDSIDKLQAFVGSLRGTTAALDSHQTALEDLAGSLGDLDGTADALMQKSVSTLSEQDAELEQSWHEAEGQIKALGESAEETAVRLGNIEEAVESDQQEFSAEAERHLARLRQDHEELVSQGFDHLHGVLTTIEGDLAGALQTLTEAFSALDDVVEAMESEVDAAAAQWRERLEAGASALREAVQEFQGEAGTAIGIWGSELPGEVDQTCTRASGALEQDYAALQALNEQKGDELLKGIEASVDQAVRDIEQQGQSLEDQADKTEAVLRDKLEHALDETLKTAEGGANDLSSMSDSLFPDLGFALKVADQVAELLKSLTE